MASTKSRLEETSYLLQDKTTELLALRETTAAPLALDQRNKELMEENLGLKNRIEVRE